MYHCLVDGKLVAPPATFEVINPSTGDVIAACPDVSAEQTEAAIQAADRSFPSWSQRDISERQELMKVVKTKLTAAKEELAKLLVLEQGKPLAGAEGEIDGCLMLLDGYIKMELPVDVYSETEDRKIINVRRPIGVVACICPWNYPLFTSVQKWAPALTIGNTVIVKPSPYTPLATLRLAAVLKDVFPPGVFNVIAGADTGDFNSGAALTAHPKVRKVSFTGSIATGMRINEAVAGDMKRVTLECGGNDAAIVRADADVAKAAAGVFGSAFANTGQLCCAAKRVFVHESIADQFTAECVKLASEVKFGDGFEKGVTHGPINNKMQYDKVSELVEDARKAGANILCGGGRVQGTPEAGNFYAPTIISGVKEGFRIVDEEQFGPVMPIITYADDNDAVARANATMFGLGGSVWGADVNAANKLAMRIQSGTVWVNQHSDLTGAPFGGFKWSGVGRELGKADITAFSEAQTLSIAKL